MIIYGSAAMRKYESLTRKNARYFGCAYAVYLVINYPEAWERFCARPDYMQLLNKYSAHCHQQMYLHMTMLRKETGYRARHHENEWYSQLQHRLIEMTKEVVFGSLLELLEQASWMEEPDAA